MLYRSDLEKLNAAGGGRIDFTVGSALDLFGAFCSMIYSPI